VVARDRVHEAKPRARHPTLSARRHAIDLRRECRSQSAGQGAGSRARGKAESAPSHPLRQYTVHFARTGSGAVPDGGLAVPCTGNPLQPDRIPARGGACTLRPPGKQRRWPGPARRTPTEPRQARKGAAAGGRVRAPRGCLTGAGCRTRRRETTLDGGCTAPLFIGYHRCL